MESELSVPEEIPNTQLYIAPSKSVLRSSILRCLPKSKCLCNDECLTKV